MLLSYSQTGTSEENDFNDNSLWGNGYSQAQRWMVTLRNEVKAMAADKNNYSVYGDKITNHTTLGDVKNQIVLKVNSNAGLDMYHYWNGETKAPLLFTEWDNNIPGDKPLPWGAPTNKTNLRWVYQEVTNVNQTVAATRAEATFEKKLEGMKTIFTRSLNEYETNNKHNIWYMNDLGGILENPTTADATLELAQKMNGEAITVLSNRDKNVNLGLVFMNFADRGTKAQAFRSDYLIQTIINNNFKFKLRRKAAGSRSTSLKVVSTNPNEWDKWLFLVCHL